MVTINSVPVLADSPVPALAIVGENDPYSTAVLPTDKLGEGELVRTVLPPLMADAPPGSVCATLVVAKEGDHSLRWLDADGKNKDLASASSQTKEMNLAVARRIHQFLNDVLAAG